jgi:ribosomal protein L22
MLSMNALTKRMSSLVLPVTRTIYSNHNYSSLHGILSSTRMCHPGPLFWTRQKDSYGMGVIVLRQFASRRSKFRPAAYNIDMPDKLIIQDPSGRQYYASDLCQPAPQTKVKPSILRKRLNVLKTYEGKQRNIRHSPWRLQLLCRHVSGQTLDEALLQLQFLSKRFAPLVRKVLVRTSHLADIRHGIPPSQLEVAECFATQGSHLKRLKIMGKGRAGILHHKYSHMRVVLRQIDFAMKIFLAKTPQEKERWIQRYIVSQKEYELAKAKREEIQSLESAVILKDKEREDKEKKKKR